MIPLSRPLIGAEERAAVDRVLESGRLAAGPGVASFESEFASFCGTKHAIGVGSGTAALHLGMLGLGIGSGDEVIVPTFTFAATANVVRLCGAQVVFVDVDPESFCLNIDQVAASIGSRTVAIVAVHLYGQPADLGRLEELADRAGIALIEDAAQAPGASWEGRPVGAWGAFGAFSFYPTKNMTTGEGGMVTTNDDALARTVRLLRNQGMSQPYQHEIVGMNERMTEIEAAIGLVQLRSLPAWNRARKANAAYYEEHLDDLVATPRVHSKASHVFHQYTVKVDERVRIAKTLDEAQIGYGIYYPTPVHLLSPYLGSADAQPVSEQLAEHVLSIPVRPDLTASERQRVTHALNEAVRK